MSLKKKLLIAGAFLLLAAVGVYLYYATMKHGDTAKQKPEFTVEAVPFIREFEKDSKAANEKYAEKIITVNGIVSATEPADTTINIKMVDTTSGSYLIFAFQEQHLNEAKTIKPGDHVSIKGSCSGSIYSDILGVHQVSFKRSALNK
jgi:hypothetical protein